MLDSPAMLLSLVSLVLLASPPKVYAGVYLHDVARFDQKQGVFDVDAEVWAKWLGDFDPDQLVIANGAQLERTELSKEQDGAWRSARWRVRGTLRGEFPLQSFPFDEQMLGVELALDKHSGELVPDLASSGIREKFSITDWNYEPEFRPRIVEDVFRSDLGALFREGAPTEVRRVVFEVRVHRPPLTIGLKLFLPLAIILLVALIAQFLPPDLIDARCGVGVTALLSCFAFQFTVSDAIPAVGYLTFADRLFVIAYAVSGLTLLETIVAHLLHRAERVVFARVLDKLAAALLPLGVALLIWVWLPVGRPSVPPAAEPVRQSARPSTLRPELRVGVTQLGSLLGGGVAPAINWGMVREEPGGERWPVLVAAAPSITSDSLRFVAGGDLEVHWRLRAGARWSDGQPVTVDDLAMNLKLSPNPHIRAITAASGEELIVRFDDRLAESLDGWLPYPSRLLAPVAVDGGYPAVLEVRRGTPLPSVAPYRVAAFEKEKRLVLEKNPHFVGAAPVFERVLVTRFPDGEALVAAFERGELDVAAPNSVTPELAKALRERRPDLVHIRPSALQLLLQPDLSHPLLAQLAVRKAILKAIDREALARAIYGAAGRVSHAPIPGVPAGGEETPFDAKAARAELVEAGAKGAVLPLFHEKTGVDPLVARQVQEMLRAVGIKVELREVEKTSTLVKAGGWGGLVFTSALGERDAHPARYWNLPVVGGRYDEKARNAAFDEKVSGLLQKERRALYPERREQLREELFAAYTRRLPNLPLVFAAERVLAVPELRGWRHEDPTVRFGADLEQWHIGEPEAAPPAPAVEPEKKPEKKPTKRRRGEGATKASM